MSAGAVKAGGVFVEIGADPTKFFSALKGVNKSIASMGKAMQMSGAKMAGIGAGVVAPIFASAKAFADVGSALNDMSKRTGVATDSLSVLKYAAEQTGTDMGGVETAIRKMQKAIFEAGNGSKEAADALAMVGLSAADLEGLSANQQMGRIADGLMAIQDPGERAAIAMKLFGKSGTAILPMLEGGSAGMAAFADEAKRLGLVMDAETAAKADSLGDAIDALTSSMKMAFIQVGAAVAPMLTDMAKGMAVVAASVGNFITNNQALVVSAFKIGVALIAAGTAVSTLGSVLVGASATFSAFSGAVAFALSPLTMLIGAASGVGKSFTMALPATAKLAGAISTSMLTASASALSFASTAGTSLAGFATSSATGLAGLASSSVAGFARMSTAALAAAQAMFPVFFTGFNRGIAAGAGFFSATLRGLNGVVMASSGLRAAMSAVAGSGMAKFAKDIVGGLTLTYKSFVWWATGATARMAQYAANLTGAVGKTIASTAAMSAAWLGSAARGVAVFVGSAVAGISSYLAATAMAVAGSVASAAAVAAAWLAPLAPLLLLSAAAVGVGAAVKQFGPQIAGAFSGLAGYASDAAGAIGSGLNTAVRDGIVVFGDLAKTATTTFNGVYEAVAAGDLAGAMEIAMAGMEAAFFDVAGPFLTQVSEWATKFQGIFDDIGTGIAVAMESADGFFKKNVADLGNPQAWGAAPAIGGVPASSKEELAKRAEGIQTQTDRNVAAMESDARDRTGKRIAAASDYALSIAAKKTAAKSKLSEMVSGKTETRARNSQVDDLLSSIKGATSVDQLAGVGGLGDQFSTLRDLGRLTSEQEMMLSDALDKAAEGLTGTATAAQAGATAAGDQSAASRAEVAGTFSSVNLGGMGFGSSLAERTAKAAEDTAKGVKELVGQGGGKVAA